MATPSISVIGGVRDETTTLRTAVDSVLDQTFADFELILVDDAASAATRDVLAAYDDHRIRVIENERNLGLTKSLNRALEASKGRYIARHDADDWSHPERFERQVSYLDTHPDVAVLGTGCHIVDSAGAVRDRRVPLARPSEADFRNSNRLVHGSVMMRRDLIEATGGYDERFRQAQDYDLWLRIAAHHPIRNLPEPLYSLRLHERSVYAAHLEESLLYEAIARRMANGMAGDDLLKCLNEGGSDAVLGRLERSERREFHLAAAMALLRYDRPEPAREHLDSYRRLGSWRAIGIGLLGLAHAGSRGRHVARWGYRRWLNGTHRARNAVARLQPPRSG